MLYFNNFSRNISERGFSEEIRLFYGENRLKATQALTSNFSCAISFLEGN